MHSGGAILEMTSNQPLNQDELQLFGMGVQIICTIKNGISLFTQCFCL